MTEDPAHPAPFITRVRLRNYKSIASCDVPLGPLTILVGPNGSGKSNFLDALAFVSSALEETPAKAIDDRGGLAEILRRVPAQAESFGIAITVTVPWEPSADRQGNVSYEFEIGISPHGTSRSFEVIREECILRHEGITSEFKAEHGRVHIDSPGRPESDLVTPGRLFLSSAGAQPPFSPLFAGLSSMRFYNFNTATLRMPQPPAARTILGHSGENLGEVVAAMAGDGRGYKSRFDAYVRAVVQDAIAIEPYSAGGYSTVALRTAAGPGGGQTEFGPQALSDGTIRAAAVLAALFQPQALDGRLPLVGVEEPEIALHPAAAGVLFDALTEASEHVQVVATSQSADLLDRDDLDVSTIRPVTMRDGLTIIGEIDDASREIAGRKIYTLGELMRSNQLVPRPAPDARPSLEVT